MREDADSEATVGIFIDPVCLLAVNREREGLLEPWELRLSSIAEMVTLHEIGRKDRVSSFQCAAASREHEHLLPIETNRARIEVEVQQHVSRGCIKLENNLEHP